MAGRRGRQPALGSNPEEARERIVQSFLERARRTGIRSVVMGELASDLHMSASTLYRHFPSKQELVTACVERWAEDLAAVEAINPSQSDRGMTRKALMKWAESWSEAVSQYSTAWWDDLRKGYPPAWAIFEREMRRYRAHGADLLRPVLRDDLHRETALAVLGLLLDKLPDPDFCDGLAVTRREAIRTALSVWMDGALRQDADLARPPRLKSIDGGGGD